MSDESPDSPDAVDLVDTLGHVFRDGHLLNTALSHPSHAHEVDGSRGNERLEYLGDAVLDLVVARLLYDAHPDWSEGELTRARAAMVNKRSLARSARFLGLGYHVKLGRTERLSGGDEKDSILANCLEAVVGAIYLDAGLDPVTALMKRVFGDALTASGARPRRDPKTAFQEWSHAELKETPRYRTIADTGTGEDDERFRVEVTVVDEVFGVGTGRTKRAAERAAASDALGRKGVPRV